MVYKVTSALAQKYQMVAENESPIYFQFYSHISRPKLQFLQLKNLNHRQVKKQSFFNPTHEHTQAVRNDLEYA